MRARLSLFVSPLILETTHLLQMQQVRAIRAAGKDYYKVLGVPKNCDDAQLKKAYRKVSLDHCPSLIPGVQPQLLRTGDPIIHRVALSGPHCGSVGCAAGS